MKREDFEEFFKVLVRSGRFIYGTKEVADSLRGTKLVVIAQGNPRPEVKELIEACKKAKIPWVSFPGTSVSLGRLLRKPFRITAVGIKSAGDADLRPFLGQGSTEGK